MTLHFPLFVILKVWVLDGVSMDFEGRGGERSWFLLNKIALMSLNFLL